MSKMVGSLMQIFTRRFRDHRPLSPTARSSQYVGTTDLLLGVLRDILDTDLPGVDLHEIQARDVLEVLNLEPEQQVLGAQAARDGWNGCTFDVSQKAVGISLQEQSAGK